MYFAVLQQGGAALSGRKPQEPWQKRALVEAKALPMSLALRGLQTALEALGKVRVIGTEPVAPAAQAGAPLVPVRVTASRVVTLPGGMRLPIPGCELTVHYGEPIVAQGREHDATAELARALRGHES